MDNVNENSLWNAINRVSANNPDFTVGTLLWYDILFINILILCQSSDVNYAECHQTLADIRFEHNSILLQV